jgi:hypothetical protein
MKDKIDIPDFKETPHPPKPFPYWPTQPTEEELKRMELMLELNKWANNDDDIAQRTAETLILLLSKQFRIKLQTEKQVIYVKEQS